MKQRHVLIIMGGAAVLVLLVVRLTFQKMDQQQQEKEWFVSNLHYNFSGRIDSTIVFNSTPKGFLVCSTIDEKITSAREDSLIRSLKHFKHLKFLRFSEDGKLKIFNGATDSYHVGDSLYVNSDDDYYRFYRNGKLLTEYRISESLGERYF